MPKVTFEKFTTISREKIFDIATDFESFETIIPQFFPSIRVISVRPKTTLVEEHMLIAGKELVVMARHEIEKPAIHETFIVGGDAKGTHITEEYLESSNGTRIILTVEFKVKGSLKFHVLLNKRKIENEFSRMMDELILFAES